MPLLEPILKGLVEWIYELIVEIMDYAAKELVSVMSMDLAYFEEMAPIIKDIVNIVLALGWGLLIANMVFQSLKSMMSGIGFESEDPKQIFCRSFVFAFLLLASRQICDIAMGITGKVIELLQIPSVLEVSIPDQSMFSIGSDAKWLIVIIVGFILMFQIVKLLFEIGERYVVSSVLTFFAPLAFSMGGSRNTNDIFKGWCRMYGSMMLMTIMNIVFLKIILSAMAHMTSGSVLVWLVFVVALTRVARKIDSHIGKIGLNPAQTGGAGSRLPGMMTMVAVRTLASTIRRSINNNKTASGASRPRSGAGNRQSQRNTTNVHRNTNNSHANASHINRGDAHINGNVHSSTESAESVSGTGGVVNGQRTVNNPIPRDISGGTDRARPNIYGGRNGSDGASPSEYSGRNGADGRKPNVYGGRNGSDGTSPSEYYGRNDSDGRRPNVHDGRNGSDGRRPNIYDGKNSGAGGMGGASGQNGVGARGANGSDAAGRRESVYSRTSENMHGGVNHDGGINNPNHGGNTYGARPVNGTGGMNGARGINGSGGINGARGNNGMGGMNGVRNEESVRSDSASPAENANMSGRYRMDGRQMSYVKSSPLRNYGSIAQRGGISQTMQSSESIVQHAGAEAAGARQTPARESGTGISSPRNGAIVSDRRNNGGSGIHNGARQAPAGAVGAPVQGISVNRSAHSVENQHNGSRPVQSHPNGGVSRVTETHTSETHSSQEHDSKPASAGTPKLVSADRQPVSRYPAASNGGGDRSIERSGAGGKPPTTVSPHSSTTQINSTDKSVNDNRHTKNMQGDTNNENRAYTAGGSVINAQMNSSAGTFSSREFSDSVINTHQLNNPQQTEIRHEYKNGRYNPAAVNKKRDNTLYRKQTTIKKIDSSQQMKNTRRKRGGDRNGGKGRK